MNVFGFTLGSEFAWRMQLSMNPFVNPEVNLGTDFPADSDTLRTREKCHCKRVVTVTTSVLYMKGQLGPVKTVTLTGVSL